MFQQFCRVLPGRKVTECRRITICRIQGCPVVITLYVVMLRQVVVYPVRRAYAFQISIQALLIEKGVYLPAFGVHCTGCCRGHKASIQSWRLPGKERIQSCYLHCLLSAVYPASQTCPVVPQYKPC